VLLLLPTPFSLAPLSLLLLILLSLRKVVSEVVREGMLKK
jgi:hypothetical protein